MYVKLRLNALQINISPSPLHIYLLCSRKANQLMKHRCEKIILLSTKSRLASNSIKQDKPMLDRS